MASSQELIHNWKLAKAKLDAAKKAEMRWRILIATQLFPDVELGTNLYNDGELKLVCRENYTISKNIDDVLELYQQAVTKFPHEATNINVMLQWIVTLDKAGYEALSEAAKLHFAPVVTIKAATPTLTAKGMKDE